MKPRAFPVAAPLRSAIPVSCWRVSRCPSRGLESGQALLLGVLLAGMVAAALVAWFGLAQLTGWRTRLTHAVDAAAYSGALAQARALNMMAYLNRTQLAHQLAMAHLVTLGAWAHWGARMGEQAGLGNPPAYLVQMLFGPAHGRAYEAARRAIGLAAPGKIPVDMAQALALHQQALDTVYERRRDHILASLPDMRRAAIRAVLDQHLQHEPAGTVSDELYIEDDGWPGYVQLHDGPDYLRALVQELASRYAFLSPRQDVASSPWVVDPRCPHLRHQLRRRGETGLDERGRWSAVDTQSFHAVRANQWVGCYFREYAMGWGWLARPGAALAQPHVVSPPADFSTQDFWRWVRAETGWGLLDDRDNPLANSWAVSQSLRWAGGGLRAAADVTPSRAHLPLQFSVRWQREDAQGQRWVMRSAAASYYARPPHGAETRDEPANLFLPYWLAKLADRPIRARPRNVRTALVGRVAPRGSRGHRPGRGGRCGQPAATRRMQSVGGSMRQRGQSLSEALVVLGWLVAAWLAVNALGRWQDMALQASHASRLAVFAVARGEPVAGQHAWRQHYFSAAAHRWQDHRGQALLGEHGEGAHLRLARTAPLIAAAQPGGEDGPADILRRGWAVADAGILQGRVSVGADVPGTTDVGRGVLSGVLSSVQRHAYLLTGSGHADGDADVQRRAAANALAWADIGQASAQSVARTASRLSAVDEAWARPSPSTDWWSAWAGMRPTASGLQQVGLR